MYLRLLILPHFAEMLSSFEVQLWFFCGMILLWLFGQQVCTFNIAVYMLSAKDLQFRCRCPVGNTSWCIIQVITLLIWISLSLLCRFGLQGGMLGAWPLEMVVRIPRWVSFHIAWRWNDTHLLIAGMTLFQEVIFPYLSATMLPNPRISRLFQRHRSWKGTQGAKKWSVITQALIWDSSQQKVMATLMIQVPNWMLDLKSALCNLHRILISLTDALTHLVVMSQPRHCSSRRYGKRRITLCQAYTVHREGLHAFGW